MRETNNTAEPYCSIYEGILFDVGPDGIGYIRTPSGDVYPVHVNKQHRAGDKVRFIFVNNNEKVTLI